MAFVCNTWFEKKNIHKQTWQHPKSKQWHCIDFIIMRQSDRKRCLDAAVMRGAECHTDHQLLCARVKVTGKGFHRKPAARPKRFNVAKLTNSEDCADFQEETVNRTQTKWPHGGSAEEKWSVMRSALTEAAETVLGTEPRRPPDWFRESKNLKPALQLRNQLYNQWLASKSTADLQRFRKARSETRQAIRAAKNAWFQAKAEEAQRGRFGGKAVWQCIRAMQSGRRGLVPSTTGCVRDEDGNKCTLLSEQHQRWQRHFTKVLNMRSQFEVAELERTRQRPIRAELAAKPTMEELTAALAKLKNGKAGGSSHILPEMLKAGCCTEEFLTLLLDLVHTTWNRECLGTGQMQFSSLSQRRETYRFATIGEGSPYWRWWEKWWLGSCRRGYSRLRKTSFPSHSVDFAKVEAALT